MGGVSVFPAGLKKDKDGKDKDGKDKDGKDKNKPVLAASNGKLLDLNIFLEHSVNFIFLQEMKLIPMTPRLTPRTKNLHQEDER